MIEMVGGPQDGLQVSVPTDCHELRFPAPMLGAVLSRTWFDADEPLVPSFSYSIYRRIDGRFYYDGTVTT